MMSFRLRPPLAPTCNLSRRQQMNMFPDFNRLASYAFFFSSSKWERDSRSLVRTLFFLHTAPHRPGAHCPPRCAPSATNSFLCRAATARRGFPARKFNRSAARNTTTAGCVAHRRPRRILRASRIRQHIIVTLLLKRIHPWSLSPPAGLVPISYYSLARK